MKRVVAAAVAGTILGGLMTVVQVTPASAAITTTVSGSTITVNATGTEDIYFPCQASKVTVNNVPVVPALNCSALTKVTVIGDDARQIVRGSMLDEPTSYPLHPSLTGILAGGNDLVFDTLVSDNLSLGAGLDGVVMNANGVPNLNTDLGTDVDNLFIESPSTSTTLSASSSGTTVSVLATTTTGSRTLTAFHAEGIVIRGGAGNDTLDTVGVTVASTVDFAQMDGGAGNDTMTAGPVGATMGGGTGTNTFNGAGAADSFGTESDTDTINTGGGTNSITDDTSLRTGGRTINAAAGSTAFYSVSQRNLDSMVRYRSGPAGTSVMTSSLNRSGQQQLPQPIDRVSVDFYNYDPLDGRHLADVVTVPDKAAIFIGGDPFDDDLADITVPTGTWSTTGTPGSESYTVITNAPGLPNVETANIGPVAIHGPWTDENEGFGHRVVRDLLFRFATDSERGDIQADLAGGSITRADIVRNLMTESDDYNGLDVDRVYVKYLRRASDPGGRTSWITAIDNGKPLWRFRAQLIGSNEYFNKAGATNEAYMIRAYNDVMGRQPDPSGQAYWTNKLNHGANRGSVALQFLASTEARRNIVKDQFLRFLDRYPTTTESDHWIGQLGAPRGEQDLIAFLATSTAYYNRN